MSATPAGAGGDAGSGASATANVVPDEATTLALEKKTKDLGLYFGQVHDRNVKSFRLLNSVTLPVRYSEKFYRDLLDTPGEVTKMGACAAVCWFHGAVVWRCRDPHAAAAVYFRDIFVGGICCRLEPIEGTTDTKLYIMTLGVLAPYRGQGIGACAQWRCVCLCSNVLTLVPRRFLPRAQRFASVKDVKVREREGDLPPRPHRQRRRHSFLRAFRLLHQGDHQELLQARGPAGLLRSGARARPPHVPRGCSGTGRGKDSDGEGWPLANAQMNTNITASVCLPLSPTQTPTPHVATSAYAPLPLHHRTSGWRPGFQAQVPDTAPLPSATPTWAQRPRHLCHDGTWCCRA